MKKCAVFTGGEILDYSRIDTSLFCDRMIISADSGYIHAKAMGIKTDILIGDFDSLEALPDDVGEIISFSSEKDDTDTMLAVKLALNKGFDDIIIVGGLGYRLDHTFANIQTLAYIHENGAEGFIVSDNERIFFLQTSSLRLERLDGYSLSVFSFGEELSGVTLKGVKYPLNNAAVTNFFPIGVCNEISAEFAEIEVKSGKMLIIQSKI